MDKYIEREPTYMADAAHDTTDCEIRKHDKKRKKREFNQVAKSQELDSGILLFLTRKDSLKLSRRRAS